LVDRLEKDFGTEHKVTHYVGAILPRSVTFKDTFTIAQLRHPDIAKKIQAVSTFYIPPLASAVQTTDAVMAQRLEWNQEDPAVRAAEKLAAISQMDAHVPPADHKSLIASAAMKKFMIDIATSPELSQTYKADPSAVVVARGEGLTEAEKFAARLGRDGAINRVMKATQDEIIQRTWKALSNEEIADEERDEPLMMAFAAAA
jgi:hypothetical protein